MTARPDESPSAASRAARDNRLASLVASGAAAQPLRAALLETLTRAQASGRSGGGFEDVLGTACYLKWSPMRGRTRLRHGLRRWLGTAPPRLRELANLEWLRAHGFDAPEPLLAGVDAVRGLPTFQFLVTRRVEGVVTVRDVFERDAPGRERVIELLARECARLHREGFVHGDLFPRNLLVDEARERLWFLDAWRHAPPSGEPRARPSRLDWPWSRGEPHDLACLMVFGARLFRADEQARWFRTYFDARYGEAFGPRERHSLVQRIAARRGALVRHLLRRGRTTPRIPSPEWRPVPSGEGGRELEFEQVGDA